MLHRFDLFYNCYGKNMRKEEMTLREFTWNAVFPPNVIFSNSCCILGMKILILERPKKKRAVRNYGSCVVWCMSEIYRGVSTGTLLVLLVARPLESSSLLHPPLLEASTLPQCSWQRKPRHHLSPTYAECCLLPSGAYNWRSGFPQPGVRLQSSDQLQIWVSLMPPCRVGIGIGIRLCVVSASAFWCGGRDRFLTVGKVRWDWGPVCVYIGRERFMSGWRSGYSLFVWILFGCSVN